MKLEIVAKICQFQTFSRIFQIEQEGEDLGKNY